MSEDRRIELVTRKTALIEELGGIWSELLIDYMQGYPPWAEAVREDIRQVLDALEKQITKRMVAVVRGTLGGTGKVG